MYDAKANAAYLHRQFGHVKNYCSDDKIKQWINEKIPIAQRWVEAFKHLKSNDCEFKEMATVVEYIVPA